MSKEQDAAIVFGGVVVFVLLAVGIQWAIIHGIMELLQWAAFPGWEPTWGQSMVATMVYMVIGGLFKVRINARA